MIGSCDNSGGVVVVSQATPPNPRERLGGVACETSVVVGALVCGTECSGFKSFFSLVEKFPVGSLYITRSLF